MSVTQIFYQDYIKVQFWQISLTSFKKVSWNIIQICGFSGGEFCVYTIYSYLCILQITILQSVFYRTLELPRSVCKGVFIG